VYSVPTALICVGIPAYLIVVGLSVRDIARSHSAPVAAVAVAAVALFSAVFLPMALMNRTRQPSRRFLLPIVVLAVLAAGLALLGTTSAVYFIAVAAMAGDTLEAQFALPIILLATAGVAGYSLASGRGPSDSITQVLVTLVVGLFTLGAHRMAETNRELVAAREELAKLAVVNERLRFARDLHDLLGHTLTVIRAKSELATRLAAAEPTRAGREMAEVEGIARQALVEVREAVSGYRRPTLAAEIANARTALSAAGIAADVDVDGVSVSAELDEALGWVLREAVTNVVRHSGARRCRVEAVCVDGDVRLEVVDDGRGPLAAVAAGNGLEGVRERLSEVGGGLELDGAPGGGFRLVARVPSPT
jgi:two-component system sensor histidine kinase DesK